MIESKFRDEMIFLHEWNDKKISCYAANQNTWLFDKKVHENYINKRMWLKT